MARRPPRRRRAWPGSPVAVALPSWRTRASSPACLHVHAEVDQVDQDLHVPLGLHVAPHHAEGQPRLAVLGDDGRNDRVERPLVRLQAIQVRVVEGEQTRRGSGARSPRRPARRASRSRQSCSESASSSCGPCRRPSDRSCRPWPAADRRRRRRVAAACMSSSLPRLAAYALEISSAVGSLPNVGIGVEFRPIGEGQLLGLDEQVELLGDCRGPSCAGRTARAG